MTRYRVLSNPVYRISRSTPLSFSTEVYLRVVSGGTSHSQSRLAFHPYAQVIRTICTSEPVQSSTCLSTSFNLPTHRSIGFGYPSNDLGERTLTLVHRSVLRPFAFAAATRMTRLTSPLNRTPWPVFQHGRQDTAFPAFAVATLSRLVGL